MSDIEGQVITDVRRLAADTPDELAWTVDVYDASIVLELGDGSLLIPASDMEGNSPGVFFEKGVDAWEDISGSRIRELSPLSRAAIEYRGWTDPSDYRPPVLTLDTGEQLYPASDPEGNQRGVLFRVENGAAFIVDFESADGE
ncbi:hypothetical protein [Haloterrigena alkaliphila]|uniref:Uncharacterized protein n=1 Tax=Haloterrigena alkaliphila TaxID=2816475 RepID=A0A8A2VKS4_9EURY|nr:hypothetical protein [Haloterrigena alkaliphila]QSX01106.1 hypothetical protein J0X25_09190 [Haloterrigena alkaliphila]